MAITALRFPAVLVLLAACSAPDDRVARHGDGAVWTGALQNQLDQPELGLPALGLLVATPVLAGQDHRLQRELARDGTVTGGVTSRGDAADFGLGIGATAVALVDTAGGDGARSLEILGESVLLTEAETGFLKSATGRHRPEQGSPDSFPSGHTSFAFAAATFVARRLHDEDAWYGDLGWFAYVPAAYVGMNRIEGSRHFPSDVTFGAFLGLFTTNVVYDAHVGSDGHAGIFGQRQRPGWRFEPVPLERGVALTMAFAF